MSAATVRPANITLPDWVARWPAVEEWVRKIEAWNLTSDQQVTLRRLATDDRMLEVWSELTRRSRENGEFLHPARGHSYVQYLTADEAQAKALSETLHHVFARARDKTSVSKMEEIDPLREKRLQRVLILREIAEELSSSICAAGDPRNGIHVPQDHIVGAVDWTIALRGVANWYESTTATLRTADDPLTITNERGDRVVRGVSIGIAAFLDERFGDRLYGTAATLAAVAIGVETVSVRAIRSAFSD